MSAGQRWSWKLEHLFASLGEAHAALARAETELDALASSHGAARFSSWEALGAQLERLRVYAGARYALAPDDAECERDTRRAFALSGRHEALLEPLRLQIARSTSAAAVPPGAMHKLLRGAGTSDEGTARVLSLFSDQRLSPHFSYLSLMREARASRSSSAVLDHEGSWGGLLVAKAKWDGFEARVRGHSSALSAVLAQDGLTPAAYTALLSAARASAPLMHRIVALRKTITARAVRLDDLGTPLSTSETAFSSDHARAEIMRSLAPLGVAYQHDAAHALDPASGWIDSSERTGPAFTEWVYSAHPYVSLNFRERLSDAFTLGHELGHALHGVRAARAQSFYVHSPPVVLNELIANLHEELLYASLAAGASAELRAPLAFERLRNLETTFFGPIVLAELEQWVHETVDRHGAVSGSDVSERYLELLRTYCGPDLTLAPDDRVRWARSGQLFGARFYQTAHALGIALAILLADRLVRAEPGTAHAVLQLMSAGGSESAPALCAPFGVDLMQGKYVTAALALIAADLDRLQPQLEATLAAPR